MELNQAIKTRRSIRKFDERLVEKNKIEIIIEAAMRAPSACNIQGWKFIVIDQQDIKDKIVDMGGSILIKHAPVGILVVYDNRTTNIEYLDHIQSASAAIQNLLLTATELGLGSCWICHLPTRRALKKIFKIPANFSPVAYILLGYPLTAAKEMPRKFNLSQVMNYNQFSPTWPIDRVHYLILTAQKILIKIYYLTPDFIKKKFLNKFLDKKFVKKFKN